jgi:hypothetical protein
MWFGMFLCVATPSGGIGAFGGLITKGFGFNSFTSILMQIPTGAIGIIVITSSIWIQNKVKIRFAFIAALCIPAIAGAAALLKVPRTSTGGLLAAYYVCYCYAGLQPLLYAWANLNAGGTTKRVLTTATLFVAQCAGNVCNPARSHCLSLTLPQIIGPQVYLTREAPVYKTGLTVDIIAWGLLFTLICLMGLHLKRLNRKQRDRRIALGLPGDLEDMSIMTLEEADEYKLKLTEQLRSTGFDETKLYEKAYDDMTDFENPTFIYVL